MQILQWSDEKKFKQKTCNEDNENFKNSIKCWICDNDYIYYIYNDVKVRDNCHIPKKYRGFVHRDFNINVKLNHKIPVVFHNLKNYHLIMQELGKLNLKKKCFTKWIRKIYELYYQ